MKHKHLTQNMSAVLIDIIEYPIELSIQSRTGSNKNEIIRCKEVDHGLYKTLETSDNYLVVVVKSGYGIEWCSLVNHDTAFQLRTDSRLCQFISNRDIYPEYSELFIKKNKKKMLVECDEECEEYEDKQHELLRDFLKKVLNVECNIYNPGFYSLGLYCVPKGHIFKISDYDGDENIDHFDPEKLSRKWFRA